MKECVACKQDAGLLAKKTYNGYLCKTCRSYLPMRIDLKSCDTDYLLGLIEAAKAKATVFTATYSYGEMYLDSVHGMFCFSKGEKNGEPTDRGDIFSINELLETGIYCTDVKNVGTNTNRVVCDIKAKVKTEKICMEYSLVKNELCKCKPTSNGMLDITEPEKLTMFRSIFYQMIDDARYRVLKKLEDIQRLRGKITTAEQEKEWAKGVLFLDNADCTAEEVKKQQKKLMRMLHPDVHPELGEEYAQKINKAAEILLK